MATVSIVIPDDQLDTFNRMTADGTIANLQNNIVFQLTGAAVNYGLTDFNTYRAQYNALSVTDQATITNTLAKAKPPKS